MLNFLNKKISPNSEKVAYNVSLEQYRGLCAFLVLMAHGTAHEEILIDNFKWPEFIHYLNSGYLSVIIFFCISGYAIGVSTLNKPMLIKPYLLKRIIRLYPIYLISIVLCVFAVNNYTTIQIISNLLFLQNSSAYWSVHFPVFVNFAAWSLNYEVIYYLIFIAIYFVRPKVWKILGFMFACSILLLQTSLSTEFLANYLNGFYFWLMGLMIGWNIIKQNEKHIEKNLLSLLFLHLCINHLGIGKIILNTLQIKSNNNFNWLFDLPFGYMILASLTGIKNTITSFNKVLCYLFPALVFIYLAFTHRIFEDLRWIMCLIFWSAAIVLINEKKISKLFSTKLTFLGQISYGLYLLHVPVALLVKKTIFINNQILELFVKYTVWLFLTFFLAFIFEKKIQPKIKYYFLKNG